MADLDYSFAPQPHALIADTRINHGAVRLWGLVHMLKWNRIDPEPATLAGVLDVSERSIYRWIEELENKGWMRWNRNEGDPWKRWQLITKSDPDNDASLKLRRIEALISTGQASLDQVAAILNDDDDPAGGGPAGGQSFDTGAGFDSSVNHDSGVKNDMGVKNDTRVKSFDPGINGFDPGIKKIDPGVNGFDSGINLPPTSSHSSAPNGSPSDHGGGGGNHVSHKQIHQHHRLTSRESKNGSAYTPTDAERWMIEKLASSTKAAQWRHLPIEVVQAEYTRRSQAGQGWGAIFDAWEIVAPQLPSAAAPAEAPALSVTEATRRVRAIQPADADSDEVRLLVNELLAGATDEQALDHLAFTRAQRAQIERVVGQASPWEVVLVDMQSRIGRTECATWLRPARLEKIEDGRAVVAVPSAQAKAAIESRYLGMLGAALSEAVGRALQVRLVIQSSSSM